MRVCKKVMTPHGRAVERVTKHAGETVRFRIRVTNLGTESARNVVVCDVLPQQLTLVRATSRSSTATAAPAPSSRSSAVSARAS